MIFFTTEIFLLFLSPYSVWGFKHTNDDDQHFIFSLWSDGSIHGQGFFSEKHCFIVRESLAYFGNDRKDDNIMILLLLTFLRFIILNIWTEIAKDIFVTNNSSYYLSIDTEIPWKWDHNSHKFLQYDSCLTFGSFASGVSETNLLFFLDKKFNCFGYKINI